MKQRMVLLRSMQKQTFVVFCPAFFVSERETLAFIPKPYTLKNKHAKMEMKQFTQNTRKVSSLFVSLSAVLCSLSLSLSPSLFQSLWKFGSTRF
jgi:hypothetical protein